MTRVVDSCGNEEPMQKGCVRTWKPEPSLLTLRLITPNGPIKPNATKPFRWHFREQLLLQLLHLWLCRQAHLE
jgi:hypothetical protein